MLPDFFKADLGTKYAADRGCAYLCEITIP